MKAALWIAATILFFWAAARLLENRITYYPFKELSVDPSSLGIDFDEVTFTTEEGLTLYGWYYRPGEDSRHRADLLFFNGNAGNISYRIEKIKGLVDIGIGVFNFDYRGYGRSEGNPDDEGIKKDARAAYDKFREITRHARRPIGVFGESLGALPAVRTAAGNEELSFLIIEGSFPGKRAFVLRNPPFWPFYPFVSTSLDMDRYPELISCPSLIMHARHDEIIPLALGRNVLDLFGGKAVFYEIPTGGHNDAFIEDETFYRRIDWFLDRAL